MIHIRFTCKHSMKNVNMWISALRKMSFWEMFSVHLYSKIRMQTFLEISPSFYNDYRWHEFVSVYLFQKVKYQSYFSYSCQNKNKKLTWTISYSNKALMNFSHDTPDSHFPSINSLEFLVHAHSESVKHVHKSHTVSVENCL